MAISTIIPKQTAALTKTFEVTARHLPLSIMVDGNLGAETIALNYIGINGTDATPIYDEAATPAPLVLKVAKPAQRITHPCLLQIVKPVTTNAVGVYTR